MLPKIAQWLLFKPFGPKFERIIWRLYLWIWLFDNFSIFLEGTGWWGTERWARECFIAIRNIYKNLYSHIHTDCSRLLNSATSFRSDAFSARRAISSSLGFCISALIQSSRRLLRDAVTRLSKRRERIARRHWTQYETSSPSASKPSKRWSNTTPI